MIENYPILSSLPLPAYILALIIKYKYLILFPILVFEGPITTIILGALSTPEINLFSIFPLYLFVLASDICGDAMYYGIGKYAGKKLISKFKNWRRMPVNYEIELKDYFNKYGGRTIVLAKISHGLGWPVMVAMGSAEIPFKKFITYCSLTSIFKTAILISIGYFYFEDYSYIVYYLGSAASAFTVILFLIVVFYLINKTFLNKSGDKKNE